MPRLPVDGKKVIEHRISLGTYERERLDTITASWSFGRVLDPIVGLISNPYAIASTVALLEALGVLNIRGWIKENTPLWDWYNALNDGLYATYEAAQKALDEAGELQEQIETAIDNPLTTVGTYVYEQTGGQLGLDENVAAQDPVGATASFTYSILSFMAWAKTREIPDVI